MSTSAATKTTPTIKNENESILTSLNNSNNNNMNGASSQNNNGYGNGSSSSITNNEPNNTINESGNIAPSNESTLNQQSLTTSTSGSSSNNNPTSNETSSNTNSNNNSTTNQDDVCRDYLRNVCRRGKSCRYKHPDMNDTEIMRNKEPYVFCHDFQNRECRRDNCRFLHCTKQEEEIYRSTGKLPPHIQAQLPPDNSAPVCKDFLNGTCRRALRCKYRHPMPMNSFHPPPHHHHHHHHSPSSNNRGNNGPFDGSRNGRGSNYSNSGPHNIEYQSHYGRGGNGSGNMMASSNYGSYDNYSDSPNKRKRYDPSSMYHHENNGPYSGAYNEPPLPSMGGGGGGNVRGGGGYGAGGLHESYGGGGGSYGNSQRPQQPSIESSRSYLEEENASLRRRIDDLKKQVSELLSTNEYLMEQLNQIRASGQAAVAVASACGATSVASLQPQPAPGSVQSTAPIGMSAPITLQAQVAPPQAAAVAIGPLPPVSIVSSIASISLPTVSAPVTLVNSSAAAFTPSMHSSNPWPLGVDQ